ncbi:MAG: diguanylate cyclase [Candidatus Sulfotelmatobacter sp.]|jgi:diguanylate cyclase (GGDEF)-like protein
MRILLAEDSPVYQHLISGYLTEWGFDFELARDGAQAWKLLREPNAPVLALLDWVLPTLNGLEVCRNIRKRALNERYVYTVLLTGKSDRKDLIEAMEAGADDYLVKPFDAQELRARLLAGKRILDLHDELTSAQESVRFAARHDFLTRLWNRAEIVSFLERELARAKREKQPLGIVLLDVDHFKSINDSFGHRRGDIVLKELAQRLRSQLTVYDGVGRYGGAQFLLVLPSCDLAGALARTDEIRRFIAQVPFVPDLGSLSITVSMGVTVAHSGAGDLSTLLHDADLALHRAKNNGRSRTEYSGVSASLPNLRAPNRIV